jgi:hypothetical protein
VRTELRPVTVDARVGRKPAKPKMRLVAGKLVPTEPDLFEGE